MLPFAPLGPKAEPGPALTPPVLCTELVPRGERVALGERGGGSLAREALKVLRRSEFCWSSERISSSCSACTFITLEICASTWRPSSSLFAAVVDARGEARRWPRAERMEGTCALSGAFACSFSSELGENILSMRWGRRRGTTSKERAAR